MLRLCCLIFLLTCCACEGNTNARKAARGENFVPDPNHLYFLNTRVRHYRAEEVTNRATIYRHDALFNSPARLLPVLVDNWLQDRAIIRFETRPEFPEWRLALQQEEGPLRTFSLSAPPTNAELSTLANMLLAGDEILLRVPTDSLLPAFPAGLGREEAREVLNDYLKLVDY